MLGWTLSTNDSRLKFTIWLILQYVEQAKNYIYASDVTKLERIQNRKRRTAVPSLISFDQLKKLLQL